jgi:hypothetical protein
MYLCCSLACWSIVSFLAITSFVFPTALFQYNFFARNAATVSSRLDDCIELKTDHQSQELMDMAETFAKHLPPSTVSPAEVQGFLLKYKDFPKGALERVCEWRDELLATRDDEIEMSKTKQTHRQGL